MITAVDSSFLWAILKQEPEWERSWSTLQNAASEGPLVISPVAFAELAPSAPDVATLQSILERFQVRYDPVSPAAAFLAGETFKRYRQAGGPRAHLIPDFLIAAHAQVQAGRLAALDRGYFRRWFPDLRLLEVVP